MWKQVREIRNQDFVIETKPGSGYRIVSSPDRLLPIIVEKGLKTSFVGRNIYYYQSIDSTSSLAKRLAQEGAPEGSLVIAEEQFGGRGRRGRRWISPKGASILATVILRPDILPHEVPRLTILGALSIADSIRQVTGMESELRWPNEVLLNNKRVGGILTEFDAELDKVNSAMIGMGINVNFDPAEFPELANETTSLSVEVGGKVSRVELLQVLLEQIEDNYNLLRGGNFHQIVGRWNSHCWGLGKRVQVISGDTRKIGILRGTDDSGCLVMTTEGGEARIAMSGDISVKAA